MRIAIVLVLYGRRKPDKYALSVNDAPTMALALRAWCSLGVSYCFAGHFHRSWIVCLSGSRNNYGQSACFADHKILATTFCRIRQPQRARYLCAARTIHLNTIRVGGIGRA